MTQSWPPSAEQITGAIKRTELATVTGLPGPAAPPKMTERDLQTNIVQLCGWLGLLAYHTHDSRHSAAGFPDLVIVGKLVIFVELKSQTGDLRKDQGVWRDALTESENGNFRVWRPADWHSGRVRTELEQIMHRARPKSGTRPRLPGASSRRES